MSIGIYDNDLMNGDFQFFNWDALILSRFYKQKGEIVKLSPLFVPEQFRKFIIVKDSHEPDLPVNFIDYGNIKTYGYHFSELDKIYGLAPDVSLYGEAAAYFKDKNIYRLLMNGSHFKLIDNCERALINLPHDTHIFNYDRDLVHIKNSHDIIKNLLNKSQRKRGVILGAKFPITFLNDDEFLNWRDITFHPETTQFYLDFLLKNQTIIDYSQTPLKIPCKLFKYNAFHKPFGDLEWSYLYSQLLVLTQYGFKIVLIDNNLSYQNKQIAKSINRYLSWCANYNKIKKSPYNPTFIEYCQRANFDDTTRNEMRETTKRILLEKPLLFEHLYKYHYGEALEELINDRTRD